MIHNDEQIRFWEDRVANADEVKELLQSRGWSVLTDYLKDIYESKILDTFRRIPGNAQYDVGFRILQGEYQMLHNLFRIPHEIIELGDQAQKNIENANGN